MYIGTHISEWYTHKKNLVVYFMYQNAYSYVNNSWVIALIQRLTSSSKCMLYVAVRRVRVH